MMNTQIEPKSAETALVLPTRPDRKLLAAGTETEEVKESIVRIWSVGTGELVKRLTGHSGSVGVAFSPDGKQVAVGNKYQAEVWKTEE